MRYYLIHSELTGKPLQVIALPGAHAVEFEISLGGRPIWAEELSAHAPVEAITRALVDIAEAQVSD